MLRYIIATEDKNVDLNNGGIIIDWNKFLSYLVLAF